MLAELEIAVDHFPTNFPHLAEQIQFARPNLLYISNGETIDSLLQCSCLQGMADQFQIGISCSVLVGKNFGGLAMNQQIC